MGRILMAAATAALMLPAAASAQYHSNGEAKEMTKTIVDVAVEAGSFTTLVAAVKAAGLVETLSGEGPFTVFAPTDEAFARLPEGTLEALLADREKLVAVLTYHVLPGRVMAEDVIAAGSAKPATAQGEALDIRVMGGEVKVNNATVVMPDVEASNGVIHVIDRVVIPTALMAPADG